MAEPMTPERRWDCCNQPFGDTTTSCTVATVEIPGVEGDESLPSVPYDPDYGGPDQQCHDCHITRGSFHHPGCDMERCPKCGGQLIGCGCLSDDAYTAWQRVRTERDEALAALRHACEAVAHLLEDVEADDPGPGIRADLARWRALLAGPAGEGDGR